MEGAPAELVGRDAELARLARVLGLDRERAGGSIAAVVGDPGIGKTRILRAVSERADAAGRLVLEGRAAEFEREDAFALFLDAIDDYLASVNPRALERLGAERTLELARVFPALAELADPGSVTLQEERHRSHRAVRALLELLASRRPLLLILDDVHWADAASLELISHLVHRRARGEVAIALAFRPRQAPALLRNAVETGEREGWVERVALEPLDAVASAELLGHELKPALRERLFRESGGNPFYLEELGRAAMRWPRSELGISPVKSADPLTEVPPAVRAALATEIAELGEATARLVRGAAVVGDPFEPELAAVAAELDPLDALTVVDEALSSGVVRATEVPRQFRFRHPLVRRAVYESTGEGWRIAAHGRVAIALAERGAAPAARARHVEHSARIGDADAVALLSAAARETAPRAPASAAHWYAAALRLLPEDEPRRLELLAPMATALGAAGQLAESRDALRETVAALPPKEAALRVQLLPFIGLLEHLLGNHEAVAPLLTEALDELGAEETREAAILRLELASDRFYINDSDGLHELAREAHAAARAAGDPAVLVAACGLAAVGAYKVGLIAEAEERFAEGVELADRLEDAELSTYLLSLFWLGWYGQCAERPLESLRALERGIRVGRATGQGYLYVPMLVASGILLTWQGRLAEATDITEEAIDAARVSLNDQFLGWSLTLRCWIAGLAGDLPAAIALGREAVEASSRVSEHYFSKLAGCYLADVLLEAGQPDACREQLLGAVDGPDLEPLERPFRPHFYDVLTRAELASGRIREAEGWARRAEEAIEGIPVAGRLAEARRARAAVTLARGDPRAAATTALEAVELWEERDNSLEAARTRILAGRALGEAGDRAQAISLLERAREELLARGALRHADAAAGELRRLGRRVRTSGRAAPGPTGIDSLSGREREVAELVAGGRTNKEVAETLFLSEKTIESHMARIFEKLGVSKRAQVAAAIARERSGTPTPS